MLRAVLIGFISLFIISCASKFNVVRLSRDNKTNGDYLTLTTEHYLSLDGDRVLELDRGERSMTFEFRRPATIGRPAADAISVILKLYDTDPPPRGKLRLETGESSAEFEAQNVTKEVFSESVTVLDSGQRQVDNPNLANSAQAQTGYITFGRPTAAGAAQRSWHLYKFQIAPENAVFSVLRTSRRASFSLMAGSVRVEAQVAEKQLKAWLKYAYGDFDERAD